MFGEQGAAKRNSNTFKWLYLCQHKQSWTDQGKTTTGSRQVDKTFFEAKFTLQISSHSRRSPIHVKYFKCYKNLPAISKHFTFLPYNTSNRQLSSIYTLCPYFLGTSSGMISRYWNHSVVLLKKTEHNITSGFELESQRPLANKYFLFPL